MTPPIPSKADPIVLSQEDLRAVTGYAAACAQDVLQVFEGVHPADSRPREAVDAAWTFARGGKREGHCATPRGRRSGPLETRAPRPRGTLPEQPCAPPPPPTCIRWPMRIR